MNVLTGAKLDLPNKQLDQIASNCMGQAVLYARGMLPYYGWRKALRFLLCVAAQPRLYASWFDYVGKQLPQYSALTGQNDLIGKPSLRYLRRWMTQAQKIQTLRHHYDILTHNFPAPALQQLQKGITLAQLTGRSGRTYRLVLQSHITKEGEFAIHFMDDTLNTMLASIRGTLDMEGSGARCFWIGSIQGPPPPYGREDVAAATRDLNALRPKQAVLQAVGYVCQWFGVNKLYAPHKDNHISHGWRRNVLQRSKIYADYDEFWEEFSTGQASWGDFCMTLPFARRNAEDVPSKRRKEWSLRYARIDEIGKGTCVALDQLRAE